MALVVLALAPAAAGCASRAVPFDALDKAQVTIYKIQPPQPVSPVPGVGPGANNPLGAILQQLGLPPETQQQAQDLLKQWQAMGIPVIPGLPGMPGMPGANPPPPAQPVLFRGQWQIVDQRPIMDEATREKLLDLFGSADSFNNRPAQCWTPGMAVSFVDPSKPEPVDVVISLDCNAANGFGFVWPHTGKYALEPKANQTLGQIYQSLFGPVPPQGA